MTLPLQFFRLVLRLLKSQRSGSTNLNLVSFRQGPCNLKPSLWGVSSGRPADVHNIIIMGSSPLNNIIIGLLSSSVTSEIQQMLAIC